jgi:hypothetical protein
LIKTRKKKEMEEESDNNIDDESSQQGFCHGMSMTMSISGFQSALFRTKPADCLTYLFTNWRLDSSGKFQGAMSE